MNVIAIVVAVVSMVAASAATAGPADPSRFEPTRYQAQKAVYDFNFENVEDIVGAFGYVRNHLRALKEFGNAQQSSIVVVAHGNEVHALARANRAAFPDVYETLRALAQSGVQFRLCRNAAAARGYKPDDFYDVVTVVPAAYTDLANWQSKGYSYMFAAWYPKLTREEVVAGHPELKQQ
jgi:intracellular sulfur oxidation DsrE/DsrF family protein